ncbi:uncharacterized protein LOC130173330 [Seriola aureovittata]|uniref:uncharacterized protein LOC130173330 n=1 Tax=Seriola aureovittata TaxID=2871759 RepID=UPI0024BE666A|nr:uncharacterized protein LOC130173330 [Seriola aureovittata]XP_056238468.1 uncharacterized protein LOC130173330 [Seriola aureovittata]
MWSMPLCPTNPAILHAHTFTRNTPAKVTQAPASKFAHHSEGHTCVCVCVCVRLRTYVSVCVCVCETVHVCVCVCVRAKTVHLDTSSLTCPQSFIYVSPCFQPQCISFCVCFLSPCIFSSHPSSRFILSNFFCHHPPVLVLHSLCLSSPLSVTLPLFSARCDQLGDISPTDIPGDRTSGGHALLHLSSLCLPSVSPLHTWLSCHSCSSSLSSPLSSRQSRQQTSLLSCLPPPQFQALIPYGTDSDISASAFPSCVCPVIYPPFPLPCMFGLHADSDASPFFPSAPCAPTLFQPFLFFHLSLCLPLSRSLQVAVHNDGPVSPPVCQPLTCILATTSPLAVVLHAEQANKTPGE